MAAVKSAMSIFFLLMATGFACTHGVITEDIRLIRFNETYTRWMTPEQVDALAQECGAKGHGGFMDITDHLRLSPLGQNIKRISFPKPSHHATVEALCKHMSTSILEEYTNKLTTFFNRYYTTQSGVDAAEWIKGEFERIRDDAGRSDVVVEFFENTWPQPSVIARIPGTGDDAAEIVIIGAHEDSINGGATGRSPGADDDASGISTVLQVYRALVEANFQPQRTIEFHAYSAEEVGLRGSQAIAAAYQAAKAQVIAQMQLDMTQFVVEGHPEQFGLITDYVDPDLTDFVESLVQTYTDLPVARSKCGYGCSDHASWTQAGYPSTFPFESLFALHNPNIHSTEDLIIKLDLNHGMQFARVAVGFLVELSFV